MLPTKNTAFRYALKWGLILGIVLIAQFAIVYATNQFDSGLRQYLPILATAAILYVLVKKYRDSALGGIITFREAFYLSLQIYFYSNFLNTICVLIYTQYYAFILAAILFSLTIGSVLSVIVALLCKKEKQDTIEE